MIKQSAIAVVLLAAVAAGFVAGVRYHQGAAVSAAGGLVAGGLSAVSIRCTPATVPTSRTSRPTAA